MEISHSSWTWHKSDATALAGYANMMMMMMTMRCATALGASDNEKNIHTDRKVWAIFYFI